MLLSHSNLPYSPLTIPNAMVVIPQRSLVIRVPDSRVSPCSFKVLFESLWSKVDQLVQVRIGKIEAALGCCDEMAQSCFAWSISNGTRICQC